jgi:hypothetical protein
MVERCELVLAGGLKRTTVNAAEMDGSRHENSTIVHLAVNSFSARAEAIPGSDSATVRGKKGPIKSREREFWPLRGRLANALFP